jgi:Domain of unknown function (DUF3560)
MDISKYDSNDFKATYSPEDNKLRLYAEVRIDQEDWQQMKDNGWKWAPKQELFFCFWSVNNEDFCTAIAGDIMPEEMTMVERAELKADRLLILAKKRSSQCLGYQRAANDLMQRIDTNQPILTGHHSQRKAEKTELQVKRNIKKAQETSDAVTYWVWRAQGVISHADHKNSTRTITNRIKSLLKDLRTHQRDINNYAKYKDLLIKIGIGTDLELKERQVKWLVGSSDFYRLDLNEKLESGQETLDSAIEGMLNKCELIIHSKKRARTINHILNRLAYEQEQLSVVPLFEGDLTPAILQTFLRTHGADKPKVSKTDYGWSAVSTVCFPLHIGASSEIELEDQEWRTLMQSLGYEVPEKRTVKAKNPILNFRSDKPFKWSRTFKPCYLEQVELTKAEYKAIGKGYRSTGLSECGTFRYRIGFVKVGLDRWGNGDYEYKAIFLSDSKVHETPETFLLSEVV